MSTELGATSARSERSRLMNAATADHVAALMCRRRLRVALLTASGGALWIPLSYTSFVCRGFGEPGG
jgi:hypothetical protein